MNNNNITKIVAGLLIIGILVGLGVYLLPQNDATKINNTIPTPTNKEVEENPVIKKLSEEDLDKISVNEAELETITTNSGTEINTSTGTIIETNTSTGNIINSGEVNNSVEISSGEIEIEVNNNLPEDIVKRDIINEVDNDTSAKEIISTLTNE